MYSQELITAIGKIIIRATDNGISEVLISDETKQRLEGNAHTNKCYKQLEEYFAGKRRIFDIDMDLQRGTPFQKQCWSALLKVKYGETASYKDIAIAIDNPKAVRAVGMANNKNPISIIVP